jgi:hypothetical protein
LPVMRQPVVFLIGSLIVRLLLQPFVYLVLRYFFVIEKKLVKF